MLIGMTKVVFWPMWYVSYKYCASTAKCPMMWGQPVVAYFSGEPCFQPPNVT